MLKTTRSPDKPASNKNNNSKLAFSKNNNSRPTFERNNSNNKVNKFGVNRNNVEHAKKLGKLFKSGKSKSKKMFKSQNLTKLRKKLLKNGNSINFNATKDGPKFLTSDIRTAFNCLWLVFIEAPIL